MHISLNNSNQPVQFCSSNRIIRDLGDISILVRREFPVLSNTLLDSKGKNTKSSYKLSNYSSTLIEEIRGFSKTKSGFNMIKLLNSVKLLKVGNCGELADATYVACKINGYKNVKMMSLCAYNEKKQILRSLDHSVVVVNSGAPSNLKVENSSVPIYIKNKSIIVDSWMGKTNYEQNITSEYRNCKFGYSLHPDEILCYAEFKNYKELSKKDLIFLENNYPNLLKKKKA